MMEPYNSDLPGHHSYRRFEGEMTASGGRRIVLGVTASDHLSTKMSGCPHEGHMIPKYLHIFIEGARPGVFEIESVRVGEQGDSMRVTDAYGLNYSLAGLDASILSGDFPLHIFGASAPVDVETPLIFQWKPGPHQTSERFLATVWGAVYPTRQEADDEMKRKSFYPGSENRTV